QKLMDVTLESLKRAVAVAVKGNRIGDISNAVQSYVEQNGFSVVRDFVGHGVGHELHEAPEVPNYGKAGHGIRLVPGMTIAIEPMVNEGTFKVEVLDNDWTVVTKDGGLSAHFEYSIAITDNGPIILTAE
ncbi:MAG: M24 family metallopeptidase, partial [Oscillospiraceae bacterium]